MHYLDDMYGFYFFGISDTLDAADAPAVSAASVAVRPFPGEAHGVWPPPLDGEAQPIETGKHMCVWK